LIILIITLIIVSIISIILIKTFIKWEEERERGGASPHYIPLTPYLPLMSYPLTSYPPLMSSPPRSPLGAPELESAYILY